MCCLVQEKCLQKIKSDLITKNIYAALFFGFLHAGTLTLPPYLIEESRELLTTNKGSYLFQERRSTSDRLSLFHVQQSEQTCTLALVASNFSIVIHFFQIKCFCIHVNATEYYTAIIQHFYDIYNILNLCLNMTKNKEKDSLNLIKIRGHFYKFWDFLAIPSYAM
ncbi:hypothetical protein ACJX0J_039504, partial [Zea mays]